MFDKQITIQCEKYGLHGLGAKKKEGICAPAFCCLIRYENLFTRIQPKARNNLGDDLQFFGPNCWSDLFPAEIRSVFQLVVSSVRDNCCI